MLDPQKQQCYIWVDDDDDDDDGDVCDSDGGDDGKKHQRAKRSKYFQERVPNKVF